MFRSWKLALLVVVGLMVAAVAYTTAHQRQLRQELGQRQALAEQLEEYVVLREQQRDDYLELMLGRYGFNPPAETFTPGPEERWAADQAERLRNAHYGEISAQERAEIATKLARMMREWKETNPTVSAPAR